MRFKSRWIGPRCKNGHMTLPFVSVTLSFTHMSNKLFKCLLLKFIVFIDKSKWRNERVKSTCISFAERVDLESRIFRGSRHTNELVRALSSLTSRSPSKFRSVYNESPQRRFWPFEESLVLKDSRDWRISIGGHQISANGIKFGLYEKKDLQHCFCFNA